MQPLSFVYTQNAHKRGRERKGAGIDITENMSYNSSVAKLNPFRYRGYYYDTETGLYYLNSRYYDPSIGRFLNADDISYIHPTDINGLIFTPTVETIRSCSPMQAVRLGGMIFGKDWSR